MKRYLFAAVIGLASQAASATTINAFSLPWINGPARDSMYQTGDHPDGVFVLEFFANFCGACNDNAVNVNTLADGYKDNARVQVLDMSLDTDPRETASWIANHSPNHPVVNDGAKTVWNQIDQQYIPTTVVMDCKGTVQFLHNDVWDATATQQIKDTVDGLLKQPCP